MKKCSKKKLLKKHIILGSAYAQDEFYHFHESGVDFEKGAYLKYFLKHN
jgi:capsule polysaccharide export protein KpsE/RkpR